MNCQKCDDVAIVLENLLSIYRPSAVDESRDVSPLDALFRVLVRRVVRSAGNPARQTVERLNLERLIRKKAEMEDHNKDFFIDRFQSVLVELLKRGVKVPDLPFGDRFQTDFVRGLRAAQAAIFYAVDDEIRNFNRVATEPERQVLESIRNKICQLERDAQGDERFVRKGLKESGHF